MRAWLFPCERASASAEQETQDAADADQRYEAATRFLIGRTRDTKRFALLFKENVLSVFCRNLWALKPHAIVIAILSGLTAIGFAVARYQRWRVASPGLVGIVILAITWILLWAIWFRPQWIKVSANAYAERLLECSDALAGT